MPPAPLKPSKHKDDKIVCVITKGYDTCQNRCQGCGSCHAVIVGARTKSRCLGVEGVCLTKEERKSIRVEHQQATKQATAHSTGGTASSSSAHHPSTLRLTSFFGLSQGAPEAEIGGGARSAQAEEPGAGGSGSDEVETTGDGCVDDDLFYPSGDGDAPAALGAGHAPVGAAPGNPPADAAESLAVSQPQLPELLAAPHPPELQPSETASPPTSPRSGGPPLVAPMQILRGGPVHWVQGADALSLNLMKQLIKSPQHRSPSQQALLSALVRTFAEQPEYEDVINRHVQELLLQRGE
jgi:hypothetical protein